MHYTTAHRTALPHSTHQTLLIDAHPQVANAADALGYSLQASGNLRARNVGKNECEKQPPPNFVLMEVLSPLTPKFKSANSKLIFFSRPRVPVFSRPGAWPLAYSRLSYVAYFVPTRCKSEEVNSGLRVKLEIDRNFFLTNW